jgi:hypothetical protein
VVKLSQVCWLGISATVPAVAPGRYEARCRLQLLPHFSLDELSITAWATQGGVGSSSEAQATRSYSEDQLQQLAGTDWAEISSGPVVVPGQAGDVEIKVSATSEAWKRGVLFDCLSLVLLEPPPEPAAHPGGWEVEGHCGAGGCWEQS